MLPLLSERKKGAQQVGTAEVTVQVGEGCTSRAGGAHCFHTGGRLLQAGALAEVGPGLGAAAWPPTPPPLLLLLPVPQLLPKSWAWNAVWCTQVPRPC